MTVKQRARGSERAFRQYQLAAVSHCKAYLQVTALTQAGSTSSIPAQPFGVAGHLNNPSCLVGLGNAARFELQQEGKEAGRAEGAAGTGKRNGVCGAEGGVATAPEWLRVQEARRAPSEHSEVLAALWVWWPAGEAAGRYVTASSPRGIFDSPCSAAEG